MSNAERKLAFYEIAGGSFADEMQNEFEAAQKIAVDRQGKVRITAQIDIVPPSEDNPRFGEISYQVQVKTPPRKSPAYVTEHRDGIIVSDGEDIAEAIQQSLKFPELGARKVAKG